MTKILIILLISLSMYAEELPVMLKINCKNIKLSKNIKNIIRSNFETLLTDKGYTLIDNKAQAEALKEQSSKKNEECIDDSCLIDTGKMLAAKELFLIDILKIKEVYYFKIKNIDLESGNLKNSKSKIYEGKLDNIKELNNFTININISININRKKDKQSDNFPKCATTKNCFDLGVKYENFKPLVAMKYFDKSCNLNNVDSCRKMTYYYKFGIGVIKDSKKAEEYFKKVISLSEKNCKNKIAKDCAKLSYLYSTGIDNGGGLLKPAEIITYFTVKKDDKKANFFFRKAISLKFTDQNLLLSYLVSLVNKNDYYELLYACQGGVGVACNYAAAIVSKIKSVKDPKKMNKVLLKKACNLGFKQSCRRN